MSACGEWAWYHPEKGLSRFFCGSGNCTRPQCRKKFWSARVRLISALIEEYGLIRFFTLTLDPDMIDGDPWTYIHHPWSKFRKRISRRFPGWRFVAVLERHKHRDVPHIHGFTDIWMHQRDWSTQWHDSCGGSVVWVEKVDTAAASSYVSKQLEVAKYVGKDQIRAAYKVDKQYHALWRSQDTKARFELTTMNEWCIVKEGVYLENGEMREFFAMKGEKSDAKDQSFREDLEATRCPLPEKRAEDGEQDLEAEEPENQHEEGQTAARSERTH